MSIEQDFFSDGTAFSITRSDQGDGGWSIHPLTGNEERDFAPIVSGPSEPMWDNPSNPVRFDEWERPNMRDFLIAEAIWNAGLRGVILA